MEANFTDPHAHSSAKDLIKVSATSRTSAVAGAIAGVFREHKHAEVQANWSWSCQPGCESPRAGYRLPERGRHKCILYPSICRCHN